MVKQLRLLIHQLTTEITLLNQPPPNGGNNTSQPTPPSSTPPSDNGQKQVDNGETDDATIEETEEAQPSVLVAETSEEKAISEKSLNENEQNIEKEIIETYTKDFVPNVTDMIKNYSSVVQSFVNKIKGKWSKKNSEEISDSDSNSSEFTKAKNKVASFSTKLKEIEAKAKTKGVQFVPILQKVLISNLINLGKGFKSERDKFEKDLPKAKEIKTQQEVNSHLSSNLKYNMFDSGIKLTDQARKEITKIQKLDDLKKLPTKILKTFGKSLTTPIFKIWSFLNGVKKLGIDNKTTIVNNTKDAAIYVSTKTKEIATAKPNKQTGR
ncbi:hypothetical protein [Mycoplasma sp. 1654_15]|uniref:hypothetical protein n=1 Tax=Mycoplasma sp. 1654_15 TaxID=2725994 RepID=UPI0020C2E341|nr:hypothetical protein [Mycoplasma sp. 1654_15]